MKTHRKAGPTPMNPQQDQTHTPTPSALKKQIKLLATSFLLATGPLAALAQTTLNWDPGLSGGSGEGGAGTWNLTTANWFNGAADSIWADSFPFGTNTAAFGGAAGAVIVNS